MSAKCWRHWPAIAKGSHKLPFNRGVVKQGPIELQFQRLLWETINENSNYYSWGQALILPSPLQGLHLEQSLSLTTGGIFVCTAAKHFKLAFFVLVPYTNSNIKRFQSSFKMSLHCLENKRFVLQSGSPCKLSVWKPQRIPAGRTCSGSSDVARRMIPLKSTYSKKIKKTVIAKHLLICHDRRCVSLSWLYSMKVKYRANNKQIKRAR